MMRPLEWLLLLSFIPALLLPLSPQTWRRRWLLIAAPLPLLIAIAQIAIEGWRIQVAPLYLLAIVMLVLRLRELRGHQAAIRQGRGIFLSGAAALAIALCGVLAGYLLPVPMLPEPTGTYAVGVVDRELVDDVRGRRLMVSVWYPATQQGAAAPLLTHPDIVINALADSFGFPALVLQHMRYITVAATTDAPIADSSTPFPVLVFSHGMVGLRIQNSAMLQELASWGYVVVAIDHTDAAAVSVFPDGEVRPFSMEAFGVTDVDDEPYAGAIDERVFPVWVADQQFVYDTLERWQAEDRLLAGKLDLSRMGSLGHSFGGATALEVCRVDERCGAAANLDGGLYGDMLPATRPLLLMTSSDSNQYDYALEKWSGLIDSAVAPAYWLELLNSDHLSFTITELLSPILVPPNFDPRDGLQTVDRYLRAFFDMYLHGADSSLLNPTSSDDAVRWIATSS